jgi:hypothetical protein
MMGQQPMDCPSAPMQGREFEVPQRLIPCAMGPVDIGSEIIKTIDQCSRCGWVDPASLDRWAEDWYKRRMDMVMSRTALAAVGEPFTFVRGSERDITLDEGLAQAMAAATAMGQGQVTIERTQQIFKELRALIDEKRPPQ